MDFVKQFKWFALVTLVLVVAGAVMLFTVGFNMGIDFTGGTLITIDMGEAFNSGDVTAILQDSGYTFSPVQVSDSGGSYVASIRLREKIELADAEKFIVEPINNMEAYSSAKVLNVETVGGVISGELQRGALIAVAVACLLILVYISIRFEFKSGVIAVLSLVINVLILCSVICILQLPINSPFIAALLTIVGYTINNTIVIFDRLRENLKLHERDGMPVRSIVNISIKETIRRTVLASLTSLFTITALYIFGGSSIREFSLPIIVGLLAGGYTSILLCAPAWCLWTEAAAKGKTNAKGKARKAHA